MKPVKTGKVDCDGSCTLRIMKCLPEDRETGGNLGGTAIVDSRPFVMNLQRDFFCAENIGMLKNAQRTVPKGA